MAHAVASEGENKRELKNKYFIAKRKRAVSGALLRSIRCFECGFKFSTRKFALGKLKNKVKLSVAGTPLIPGLISLSHGKLLAIERCGNQCFYFLLVERKDHSAQ